MRAFEIDVDDEPLFVICNSCLRSIIFEFGMQPEDTELRIRVVRSVKEAGRTTCEHCEQDWRSC